MSWLVCGFRREEDIAETSGCLVFCVEFLITEKPSWLMFFSLIIALYLIFKTLAQMVIIDSVELLPTFYLVNEKRKRRINTKIHTLDSQSCIIHTFCSSLDTSWMTQSESRSAGPHPGLAFQRPGVQEEQLNKTTRADESSLELNLIYVGRSLFDSKRQIWECSCSVRTAAGWQDAG